MKFSWILKNFKEFQRILKNFHQFQWNFHEFQRIGVKFKWILKNFNEFWRISTNFEEFSWISVKFQEIFMNYNEFEWNFEEFSWIWTKLQRILENYEEFSWILRNFSEFSSLLHEKITEIENSGSAVILVSSARDHLADPIYPTPALNQTSFGIFSQSVASLTRHIHGQVSIWFFLNRMDNIFKTKNSFKNCGPLSYETLYTLYL